MATNIDLGRIPPPVGGDVVAAERDMQAMGWTVENGRVSIPESPANSDSYKRLAGLLLGEASNFLLRTADSVNSAMVAHEYTEYTAKWNTYQGQVGDIFDAAHQSGDYSQVPDQVMSSFDKFEQDYKKARGDLGYSLVLDQFQKHKQHIESETQRIVTTGAKQAATEKLAAIKMDKMVKVHADPSAIVNILDSLNPALFQTGNISAEKADADYHHTVNDLIKDAVLLQGLADAETGYATLEEVRDYIRPGEYIRYKKQLDNLHKQQGIARTKQMRDMESIEHIKSVANSAEAIELTPQLKKDADIFEANWEAISQGGNNYNKDQIYSKIGYAPGQYVSRLRTQLINGGNEERSAAVASILYLDGNLPPWNNDISDDMVGLARGFSELSQLSEVGNIPAQELRDRYNKYVNMTSDERKAIDKIAKEYSKEAANNGYSYFDNSMDEIFPTRERLFGLLSPKKSEVEKLETALTPMEQYNYKSEYNKSLSLYMGLGFPQSTAYKMAVDKLKKSWGTTQGIGGELYPAHMPIERTVGVDEPKDIKRMQNAIKGMIATEIRADSKPFPKNHNDVRLLYVDGSGTDAMYSVVERDPDLDIWLPYLVKDGDEIRQLHFTTSQVRERLGLKTASVPPQPQREPQS